MSKNWLFALLMMGLLSPPTLTANAPSDSGSKEALKETAIRYTDTFTNKEFMVFESVGNEGYEKEKQFSKMTFYVAPLFRLIPDPETQAVYQKTPYAHRGTVQYTFFVECFPPRIEEQALKKVNKYYSKTKGEYVFTEEQVHHMRHGKVVIKAANLPAWVKIEPVVIGTDAPNSTVMLDAVEEFTVEVPLDMDKDFQTRLDSGMKFKFVVYFNVMNLSRLTLSWSVEDIRQTSTYKQINSSGAHYVTAEQVHNITRQVAEKRNVYYYQDPGIDDKIVEKALSLFDKVRGDMQALSVQNRQQATELEAKLREGTGLSPSEFKPLTLMWDVYEKLETEKDHKTANKMIQDAYQRNQAMFSELHDKYQRRKDFSTASSRQYDNDKTHARERGFSLKAEAKWSWSGAKGSVDYKDYSKNRSAIREGEQKSHQENLQDGTTRGTSQRNIAKEQSEANHFKTDEELREYQAKTTEQKRPKVKIVGRGLNVIEKSQFEQNISSMASFVFVQPMTRAKSFTTDDNISTHSKNDVSSPKRDVFSMLEPLKQELSEKMREINQLREQANRNATQIANLRQLRDQANRNATRIENLRQSDTQQDRQINTFQTQMNRATRQMTKLTDAVSVSNDGNVGIGTISPRVKLDINGDVKAKNRLSITGSIYPHVEIINHTGTGGKEPVLIMKNYGGTPNQPTATKKGLPIGTIIYGGHNGEGEVQSARIAVRSTGDFSPWNHPVRMDFQVGGDTTCCGITRMSIDGKSGNVGIGTTEPKAKLHVNGDIYADNSAIYFTKTDHNHSGIGNQKGFAAIENSAGADALMILGRSRAKGRYIQLWDNVYVHDSIKVNRNVHAKDFQSKSDQRHKQNIQTLGSSLAKLAQVRGVRFNWKDNPEDEQIGLVAQEVEKVFPELVSTDSEGYKSIAYGKLTAVLIEAIKELQQQNEIMAQQIRALGASAD
jgi:hypothetical protein